MLKITFMFPGKTLHSLEPVQKHGDVAAPDGNFVKAAGCSLLSFRTNLAAVYQGIAGYEELRQEAFIYSSPYRVIRYASKVLDLNFTNVPPPTIFPRIFRTPLTVWKSIELEGGVPDGVDASQIRVLKHNLERRVLDCSHANGSPDGSQHVESGDYIFLVPEKTPVNDIFEE
jgi:hypothetical protein